LTSAPLSRNSNLNQITKHFGWVRGWCALRSTKMTRLNLTVIRSADIHASARFYQNLGLKFELHSHGSGPKHYATLDSDITFEIYPASEKFPVSVGTRLGFEVSNCEKLSQTLLDEGYQIKSQPKDSPWGMRAVFADPDGHAVELISK
jgi:catechol 2,3-dioxygenase-like lactoylglutathione lyase family enzyme